MGARGALRCLPGRAAWRARSGPHAPRCRLQAGSRGIGHREQPRHALLCTAEVLRGSHARWCHRRAAAGLRWREFVVILQSLHALHDRLSAAPEYRLPTPGFSLQKITFKVVLHPDGRLFGIEDARVINDGTPRPQQCLVPGGTKPSGSGLNPCFLWDNAAYMLGFAHDEGKRQRARDAFDAFRTRHVSLRSEVACPAFNAVCAFLTTWDPSKAESYPALIEAAQTGFGVFQLVGETSWVHEDPKIVAWWLAHSAAESGSTSLGQCLITGNEAPLARLHDKVKGLVGGQGAGSSLVGFNEEAFESYGKVQSFNAPVSEVAATRYMAALNAMLDGPKRDKHRMTLGDMTVVFWTDGPSATEDIFARFAQMGSAYRDTTDPQDEGVRARLEAFLRALRVGREAYGELEADPDHTRFYLLGLSPNAGRVAVRLFHSDSLGVLLENLRCHHRDIALERRPSTGERRSEPEFPPSGCCSLRRLGRRRTSRHSSRGRCSAPC
uniref:Type I-C CRISPR-associated protein Cas8c/Csd1 n=1 Tax=Eiseniibacteriota bacterium TaxID=2212470 RepID=A0A832I6N3_UNCEI